MKYFFLYYIFGMLLRNPLRAILLVLFFYVFIDRRYVGILPDVFKPFTRWQKINALKKEAGLNPYQGHVFYELGALLAEKGNTGEGIKYLEKAQELMPDYPDVQYYLGLTYLKTGALEKGKDALEKALKLNPKIKYGAPYVYLIEYLLKAEVYNDTVEQYLNKIKEYGSPEYFYKLGVIFSETGYKDKAKEMYREAVAHFSNYTGFYKKQYRYWAFRARIKGMIG